MATSMVLGAMTRSDPTSPYATTLVCLNPPGEVSTYRVISDQLYYGAVADGNLMR
jgi:hypothetical protein